MTDNEINEFLTVELFGKCYHELQSAWIPSFLVGDTLGMQCVKCKAANVRNTDYLTGDGMLKVIDAMRKMAVIHFQIDDQWIRGEGGFTCRFWDSGANLESEAANASLPHAVALAAIEYLRKEIK